MNVYAKQNHTVPLKETMCGYLISMYNCGRQTSPASHRKKKKKKKGSVPIHSEGMHMLDICHSEMNYTYRFVLLWTLSIA
jgi:hypothetical protein